MTAITEDHNVPTVAVEPAGPSLARLIKIEFRKAVDTRSGFWLLLVVALIGLAVAIGVLFLNKTPTYANNAEGIEMLMSLVLPVVGILLVTTEFSQRCALSTFTLVPQRSRIAAAKVAAGLLIALGVAAYGLALAAIATVLATHSTTTPFHDAGQVIYSSLLDQLITMAGGLGFALLFLNSPLAIVLHYIVPIALSILTSAITSLNGLGHWINVSYSLSNLMGNTMGNDGWAKLVVSTLIWVIAPIVAGLYRLLHVEIS